MGLAQKQEKSGKVMEILERGFNNEINIQFDWVIIGREEYRVRVIRQI